MISIYQENVLLIFNNLVDTRFIASFFVVILYNIDIRFDIKIDDDKIIIVLYVVYIMGDAINRVSTLRADIKQPRAKAK